MTIQPYIPYDKTYHDQLETIYEQSFPKEERKPFSLICEKIGTGQVEVLMLLDTLQEVAGFAVLAREEALVLLDYLAIRPKDRGKGYGAKLLKHLQKREGAHCFFLEVERTGGSAQNETERLRRKQFYLANGMHALHGWAAVHGVEYEILTSHGTVKEADYRSLYRNVYGAEHEKTIVWKIHEHSHAHTHTQTKVVLNRMSRIIGHMNAVKKMVEDGRDCSEVLIQLAAVDSAIKSVEKVILKDHMEHCVVEAVRENDDQALQEMLKAIDRFL